MKQIAFVVGAWIILHGALLLAAPKDEQTPAKLLVEGQSWADIPLEKRCEGYWEHVSALTKKLLPDWTSSKPKCEIAGGSQGDISWSIDLDLTRLKDKISLRYMISETSTQKPQVSWCVVKNKKTACASPWDTSFSKGTLYKKPEEQKQAYDATIKLSNGFVIVATELDQWVSKKGGEQKIYEVSYASWVKSWASSIRSLPTPSGYFLSSYEIDHKTGVSGTMTPKDIPASIRNCFACAKSNCEGSPIQFEFYGISLKMTREQTEEERKKSGQRQKSISWIILAPTPFVDKKPQWPMLCGEHRFNVQRL